MGPRSAWRGFTHLAALASKSADLTRMGAVCTIFFDGAGFCGFALSPSRKARLHRLFGKAAFVMPHPVRR